LVGTHLKDSDYINQLTYKILQDNLLSVTLSLTQHFKIPWPCSRKRNSGSNKYIQIYANINA